MGEKLNHFSHEEHPLILIQVRNRGEVCYGCRKQILEPEEAYSCIPCHFFLHKRCAELPLNIWHPLHFQHPLVLFKEPPYRGRGSCYCDACKQDFWNYFTYHCSYCEFDLDVTCAMMEGKFEEVIVDLQFKHEYHEHPLILQQRPASFLCDACHVEEGKDSLYVCTICPFLIHKRCSTLQQTVKHTHHNHSLTLAYCIPEDYRRFKQKCTVCHREIPQTLWVYYCAPCRYFVHIKCVKIINASDPIIDGESDRENQEYDCNQNLVKLPVATPTQELIKHFLLNRNDEGSSSSAANQNEEKTEEVILHFSHNHSLCLSTSRKNQNITNIGQELQLCDGCIEPIYVSDLHYSCFIDCGYFLHVTCSKLPNKLRIPKLDQEHLLTLEAGRKAVGHFLCYACYQKGNGLLYKCKICDFQFCIKCAIARLSTSIMHKGHHELHLTQFESSNRVTCNACGYFADQFRFGFGCEDCHFYLDSECALLPSTFKPKNHHLLDLLYLPFPDHPDEFYCVICEREINPNHWIYHCKECDYSLHTKCIPQFGKFKNLKFGRILCVDNHSHPLTYVPQATFYKLICDGCGRRWEWEEGFECEACQFFLCRYCANGKELQLNVSLLSLNE